MTRMLLTLGAATLSTFVALPGRERAPQPSSRQIRQPETAHQPAAYDLWGESISPAQAAKLLQTPAGRQQLSPASGAVEINADLIRLGEDSFYTESFRNEVFLTDVMGLMNGPIKPLPVNAAILSLRGEGTANLQVELAEDAVIGGVQFRKGQKVDTGLDVPKGSIQPLGLKIELEPKLRVGITCALCHSSVDPQTMKVVHGAPNLDLNAGLLIAMAPNSSSYLVHPASGYQDFARGSKRLVTGTDGKQHPLPDPYALEDRIDAKLLKWPRGSFDSMTDLVDNPTQIPDSFVRGEHPYSWSGAFGHGPFKGLSVQNNNVHGLNSDAFTEADSARGRWGIDPEVFYAILLQNAANPDFRYDPSRAGKPSDFFRSIDPTPRAPGLNDLVALPTYPKATLLEPTGLWASTTEHPVWKQINAMSAWQRTLVPPPPPMTIDPATQQRGRAVFEKAGCIDCHSGPMLTNNRIIPIEQIRTQPSRALAMTSVGHIWENRALGYAFDTKVPLPHNPQITQLPSSRIDWEQVKLAHAWESAGGYKVPGLSGLYWSPPYLHDGGVAVGPGGELGISGTLYRGIWPDPYKSLEALLDRDLRRQVIDANRHDPALVEMNIEGIGHEFRVDQSSGFTQQDRHALITWLLTYRPPPQPPSR